MTLLTRLRRQLRLTVRDDLPTLRPVFSVVAIVATLFFLVFLQMEERRLGYSVLKLSRIYREKLEDRRTKEIQLARSLRLEKMESMAARKLTLRRTVSDQVIHLNDEAPPEAAALPNPKTWVESKTSNAENSKRVSRPATEGTIK